MKSLRKIFISQQKNRTVHFQSSCRFSWHQCVALCLWCV